MSELNTILTAINNLDEKWDKRASKQDDKIAANTAWRNQMMGKMTVLFTIIGIGVNFAMDWVRTKLSS